MTSELRYIITYLGSRTVLGQNALFVALECKLAKLNMKYAYNFWKYSANTFVIKAFTTENCLGINPDVCSSIMSTIERIKFLPFEYVFVYIYLFQ